MAKKYEELTFTDNFMFCKVMTRNPELAKSVIELIIGEEIEEIIVSEAEKSSKVLPDTKGSRLDVYVRTVDGRVIDIEMQTTLYSNLPRRMRYYQAIEDVNLLVEGEDYNKLPENIVIFIVLEDPYDFGFYKYTFENRCEEDSTLLFGDGTKKIFVNASGESSEASPEMQSFLSYLKGGAAMSDITKEIDDAVESIRLNRLIGLEYMSINAHDTDVRNEGIRIGEARGLAQGEEEIKQLKEEIKQLKEENDRLREEIQRLRNG